MENESSISLGGTTILLALFEQKNIFGNSSSGVDFINCLMLYAKLFALYAQLIKSFCAKEKFGAGHNVF